MNALEAKVLSLVDTEATIQLASDMIKVPSPYPQEAQFADFLRRRLAMLGFESELYELRDLGIPSPGRPSVVFRIPGTGDGPALMFNGHIQTAPILPGWAQAGENPFSGEVRSDGLLYGLGAVNMKAALACYVYALKAIRDAGVSPKGDLVFAGVAAETQLGAGTRHLLECGVTADMAIVGEQSELVVLTAHTGVICARIRILGRSAHPSTKHLGVYVAPRLARVIDAVEDELEITYDPAYGGYLEPIRFINHAQGGDEYLAAQIMSEGVVTVIVRGPRGVTPQSVKADLDRLVRRLAQRDPDFKAEVTVLNPMPRFMGPLEVSPDEFVVRAIVDAHTTVTGAPPIVGGCFRTYQNRPAEGGPSDDYLRGLPYLGTDAGTLSYFGGVPSLVYGPGGALGTLTPPERVPIRQIEIAARVFALAALRVATSTWEEVRPCYKLPSRDQFLSTPPSPTRSDR